MRGAHNLSTGSSRILAFGGLYVIAGRSVPGNNRRLLPSAAIRLSVSQCYQQQCGYIDFFMNDMKGGGSHV
jgi:hypothetical protein